MLCLLLIMSLQTKTGLYTIKFIVACIVVNSSRPPKDGGIRACEKGDYCGIELAKKCLDSAFKNKYIVARNYDETLTVRMITHTWKRRRTK